METTRITRESLLSCTLACNRVFQCRKEQIENEMEEELSKSKQSHWKWAREIEVSYS